MGRRPIIAFFGMLVLLLPLTRLVASAAPPGSTKPPGNNGTVKIDGIAFDDHPNNEPHVGCVFQIDLSNYDEGDLHATSSFELWAPTGSGLLEHDTVAIGEDPNGGGRDLDASVTVDLTSELLDSGGAAHPKQGWHVRLTVHAEGSIGADVKHKMFWVRCAMPSPSPSPSPTPSVSPSGSPSPSPSTSVSPSTSGSPSPSGSESPSPTTSVSPTSPSPTTSASPSTTVLSNSPPPSTTVLGGSPGGPPTAFSGGTLGAPAVIAAALLALGALALRLASRRAGER
jgi:hypothetical protein